MEAATGKLVHREHHRGECGEGSEESRAESCAESERCMRPGNPESGQGSEDKASGYVDAQRRPGKSACSVRVGKANAVAQLSSDKGTGAYRQPGAPSRYAGVRHSAVPKKAANVGVVAVDPKG